MWKAGSGLQGPAVRRHGVKPTTPAPPIIIHSQTRDLLQTIFEANDLLNVGEDDCAASYMWIFVHRKVFCKHRGRILLWLIEDPFILFCLMFLYDYGTLHLCQKYINQLKSKPGAAAYIGKQFLIFQVIHPVFGTTVTWNVTNCNSALTLWIMWQTTIKHLARVWNSNGDRFWGSLIVGHRLV